MNCGVGPDGLLGRGGAGRAIDPLPLIVQPNAGMPKEVENRRIYLCSPEYLAELRQAVRGLGRVGGGRLLRHHARPHPRGGLGRQAARAGEGAAAATVPAAGVEPKPPAPLAEKSQLGARLADRQWITTVELLPPRGYDLQSTVEKAKTLQPAGRQCRSTSPTARGPAPGSRR